MFLDKIFHCNPLVAPVKMAQDLQNAYDECHQLEEQIEAKRKQLFDLDHELHQKQQDINTVNGIITMQELGAEYIPEYNNQPALERKITHIETEIGSLIGMNRAILTTRTYRIDGSEAKGQKFQKTFCENLLIGFNTYVNKKKKSITAYNLNTTKELIQKKFDKMNQKADIMGVSINKKYLDLTLQLLQAELDYKLFKVEEREKLKEERRRLREQENLLAEAEKTKLELQKQRRMYEQSLTKALTEQERQEFEAKLKEIDKREADVDYRINNSRAGYVYVTATKAMPNMTKIGVTRRLNPLVRLSELSSASVPFPFVCYGLVFSDDAFNLETKVHEYFDDKRTNIANKHKEFFNITPQEAIKVLKEEFGCDVHFVNEEESEEENETN